MMTMPNENRNNEEPYSGNIGLWFYSTFFNEYFKPNTPPESNEREFGKWLKEKVKPVLEAQWGNYNKTPGIFKINPYSFIEFPLKTIYPGLVCGIGYEHELGFPNEFKFGFSFDHTSGLPYIPGSSVKGTLRSAFKHDGYPKSIINDWITKECPNELKDKIEDLKKIVNQADWRKLEDHIFEGKNYSDGVSLNTYKTDAFFDAYISTTSTENQQKFLSDDYITCHQNRKDSSMTPFTNPNPVRFLKVRSDVEFTFGFRLSDIDLEDGITFDKNFKRELFKQILLDLGIGAKTNVGYGQFEVTENTNANGQKQDLK